jgi:RNA polymerase sigma-70 factor, ECF subfamily
VRVTSESTALISAVFREEWGRILAGLIHKAGSFDLAEDALQDAFASALATWPANGAPENPPAWITAVAQRKLVDLLRRAALSSTKADAIAYEIEGKNRVMPEEELQEEMDMSRWPDDRLRLIFTCCHPALNLEAQVALCLRMLGGLSTLEIARAFLLPEATLAQRLVRAKRKIRAARIPYEVPSSDRITERLTAAQAVIYLIFNEGYLANSGERLIRPDLCGEAIRLARILAALMPAAAENLGLLALLLLQHSRRDARMTPGGDLVTLEEQDRSQWHKAEIEEGLLILEKASSRREPGPYQLQAAVAAVHAQAKSAPETDWKQIAALYRALMSFNDSAVVRLNHAVAVAMSDGFETGLRLVDELAGARSLEDYYLLPAARADLLRRLGRHREAQSEYARALELVTNDIERRYLLRRLESLATADAGERSSDNRRSVNSGDRKLV